MSEKTIDLMFVGNIDKTQNIETIILIIKECKDIKSLYWPITGEVSELENIKNISGNKEEIF